MQLFGIEIRKANNLALLSHVDKVLQKFEVTKENIGDKARVTGALQALQSMMKSASEGCGRFDICSIREAAELCNICISNDRVNFYRIHHCIQWSKMTKDNRELLMAMVLDDFREVLTFNK